MHFCFVRHVLCCNSTFYDSYSRGAFELKTHQEYYFYHSR